MSTFTHNWKQAGSVAIKKKKRKFQKEEEGEFLLLYLNLIHLDDVLTGPIQMILSLNPRYLWKGNKYIIDSYDGTKV